jgi:hypothetical protein
MIVVNDTKPATKANQSRAKSPIFSMLVGFIPGSHPTVPLFNDLALIVIAASAGSNGYRFTALKLKLIGSILNAGA